jgi:hypothetical protein
VNPDLEYALIMAGIASLIALAALGLKAADAVRSRRR